MKTLTLTLAAAALVAASATGAFAIDGPHNTVATGPSFADVYAPAATSATPKSLDDTSAATLRLSLAGEARSQQH